MTTTCRRAVGLVLLIALTIATSACFAGDRGRGLQQAAASLDAATGKPAVLAYVCPGQHIAKVTLFLMNKKGSERARTLWSITQTAGATSSTTRFVAGTTPTGFTQDMPLTDEIPPTAFVEFNIEMGISTGIAFRLSDLRAESLFVDPAWFGNKSYVNLDRFNQVNAKEC